MVARTDTKDTRVLVVSGDPQILAQVKRWLRPAFEVGIAATRDAAKTALDEYGAKAVVICLGSDSAEAFEAAKGVLPQPGEGAPGPPVVFLAEADSEADEDTAFGLGAADYCVRRPNGAASLIRRINLRVSGGAAEAAPVQPGDAAMKKLNGKTILVAEDVALNRTIIEAILSDIPGLELRFAENGLEALGMFKQDPGLYALILMDVQMPEMDGLEATEAIRATGGAALTVPIIALTASTDEDDVARCMDAGMDGFLEKPVDYDKFLCLCAEHIK